jgi:hypothetical protein
VILQETSNIHFLPNGYLPAKWPHISTAFPALTTFAYSQDMPLIGCARCCPMSIQVGQSAHLANCMINADYEK